MTCLPGSMHLIWNLYHISIAYGASSASSHSCASSKKAKRYANSGRYSHHSVESRRFLHLLPFRCPIRDRGRMSPPSRHQPVPADPPTSARSAPRSYCSSGWALDGSPGRSTIVHSSSSRRRVRRFPRLRHHASSQHRLQMTPTRVYSLRHRKYHITTCFFRMCTQRSLLCSNGL